MKHIKLFLDHKIEKQEYPENGHELSSREKQILEDLVGYYYMYFNIRKEDNYYYTYYHYNDHYSYYYQFDGFGELKDYLLCSYYIKNNKPNELLELLKISDFDPSFDKNSFIRWASYFGHLRIVKILLQDPRVDPSTDLNYAIRISSEIGHVEVVKLLLRDSRVDPSDLDNYCIKLAGRKRHIEIVRLLIQDPRVRENLTEKEINEYETY